MSSLGGDNKGNIVGVQVYCEVNCRVHACYSEEPSCKLGCKATALGTQTPTWCESTSKSRTISTASTENGYYEIWVKLNRVSG
jgi:hypothetical protein